MSSDGKSRAAIAEALLKQVAQSAGPFIGGGVGIAEVENVNRIVRLATAQTQESFENGRKGARLMQRQVG